MCVHTWWIYVSIHAAVCVEFALSFHFCVLSRDQVRAVRLVRQAPSPAQPSQQPQTPT